MAGYIGSKAAVVSSGAERKKVFTATSGQTSFTGLSYTVNNVHVFQNGVRLVDGTDYTATDGNSITLTVGAATDDQVVVVSYNTFQTSDTVSASTGGTFAGDVNFTGAFTSQGIDDNATSTAMTLDASGNLLVGTTSSTTGGSDNLEGVAISSGSFGGLISATRASAAVADFNRKTNNGSIVNFRKDGTTVGSIGVTNGGSNVYYAGGTGKAGVEYGSTAWVPWQNGARADASIDLGGVSSRFKDLYLSGGVYLGGTGAANKLDDYEEGTYVVSLTCATSGSITLSSARNTLRYTKVGNVVFVQGQVAVSSVSSPSGDLRVSLPFTVANLGDAQERGVGTVALQGIPYTGDYVVITTSASDVSYADFLQITSGGGWIGLPSDGIVAGDDIRFGFSFYTND